MLAVLLRRHKSAEALLAAFEQIMSKHVEAFGTDGHKIVSVSFDLERAVLSDVVQAFLRRIIFASTDFVSQHPRLSKPNPESASFVRCWRDCWPDRKTDAGGST